MTSWAQICECSLVSPCKPVVWCHQWHGWPENRWPSGALRLPLFRGARSEEALPQTLPPRPYLVPQSGPREIGSTKCATLGYSQSPSLHLDL